ncbi:MAG: hypothetical protein AAF631_11990, partial [Pseudomonadota bacterium]
ARAHVANADRADHFPGNLPAEPRIRNRNPKGYLANLLWANHGQHQSFLYDFRDDPRILTALAHDEEATIVMIRHAWLISLLNANQSFEATLATARRYLRIEQRFLEAFGKTDATANLVTLPLETAVGDPGASLELAISQIDPGSHGRLREMPERVTVDGLDALVRKLRNRGLNLDYEPAPRRNDDAKPVYQKPYAVK